MDTASQARNAERPVHGLLDKHAFSRIDESSDGEFYSRDRLVSHLDSIALETTKKIIGELIVGEKPVILDLMASWDSHVPGKLEGAKIVGLGLNGVELSANKRLSQSVIHDLNADPVLPFPDETFDAVVNTVSVDYLVKPIEIFREVGRVLKPNGLFLVVFSNRMFPEKAVKVWRESSEERRVELVRHYFEEAGGFDLPKIFISSGRPRPADDKYHGLGIPSDPVYAVYADKHGPAEWKSRRPDLISLCVEPSNRMSDSEALETRHCPYCGKKMNKWAFPNHPFVTWDLEHAYICFNDECPYLMRGWRVMSGQGNPGVSYRLMCDPVRNTFLPVPVPSLHALKDGIVE